MSLNRSALTIGLASVIASAACANVATPSTGLVGAVVRGPVAPVCAEGMPCTAPFSAHFTVRLGSRVVASFQSDASGRYTVRLEPGTYRIVPGADAPIIDPASQSRTAIVGSSGLTTVDLEFDTGIR